MPIREFLKNPEDFVVEEVTSSAPKYKRTSSGIEKTKKHTLFVLEKKEMTTEEALGIVAKRLNIPLCYIGYAGLKDKFACTKQFVTVRGEHNGFDEKNIALKKIGYSEKELSVGDLLGNRFVVTLHGVSFKAKNTVFPNFFGDQRFGAAGDNCIIGKMILQRRYKEVEAIKDQLLSKDRIKFYIHSYQSFVFNDALKKYMKKNKIEGKKGELIGFDTVPKNKRFYALSMETMKKDSIDKKSFEFRDLKLKCRGATRDLAVRATHFECVTNEKETKLSFFLPKGCYGTVFVEFLLGKIKKD